MASRALATFVLLFCLLLGQSLAHAEPKPLFLTDQSASPCEPAQESFEDSAPDGAVLVGLKIRSGAFVDGVTPIYADVRSDGLIADRKLPGRDIGGRGGNEVDVLRPGHVVVGFNLRRGTT